MALMRVLDLFSGIGGFSLGLERAGMQTVAFCEIEPYPRAVLRKHWPNVPCYEDVRTLTAERLNADGIGPIDVICGGFPCQPFSQAGKQLAEKDVRHLWPEYFRLVKECRPSWVIGENVIGLINLGLDAVLDDLEGIGYATRTFDIPACAVGAPHYRRRVWITANATSGGRASGFNGDTKSIDVVSYSEDLAYSDCSLLQGGGGAIMRKDGKSRLDMLDWLVESQNQPGRLNPEWVEWLMGFPVGWTELKPLETPLSRKSQKSSGGQ